MPPRFQADEDFNVKIVAGVLRREPSVDFQTTKAARILGLRDPDVLAHAAQDNRIVVSHGSEHDAETLQPFRHRIEKRRTRDRLEKNGHWRSDRVDPPDFGPRPRRKNGRIESVSYRFEINPYPARCFRSLATPCRSDRERLENTEESIILLTGAI